MTPKFEILTMAPENTNSVLMTVGADAVIFDAWGRADDWAKLLDDRGLRLRAIYTTHGHPDHISAAPELAARFDVPWYMNPADRSLIAWGRGLLEYFGLPVVDPATPTVDLPTGQFEILPGVWADVVAAPGHTPGGVVFYFRDLGILIVGDTLFMEGIGRCDLPGGDRTAMERTLGVIQDMNLPDDTFVISGHGAGCTWGEMRHVNPYLRPAHGCSCGCDHHHCDGACDHECHHNHE